MGIECVCIRVDDEKASSFLSLNIYRWCLITSEVSDALMRDVTPLYAYVCVSVCV